MKQFEYVECDILIDVERELYEIEQATVDENGNLIVVLSLGGEDDIPPAAKQA